MDLTSFHDTEKKINSLKIKMAKFDLKKIKKILKILEVMPEKFFTIHITGSNGKGSTTAFISSILAKAGFKIGTYISPHVQEITERIKFNNKNISKKDFIRIAFRIFECIEKNKIHASYFEFLTAMAFLYFDEKKPDFTVCEVGLGGRLDATNVLNGKINVFTSISLEHTQTLGNSIKKIATEKAGIIKPNSLTIIGEKNPGLNTILKIARKQKSRIVKVRHRTILSNSKVTEFELIKPQKTNPFKLSLIGKHQAENAGLVLAVILELKKKGFKIPLNAIKKGFLKTKNRGRLEIMKKNPLIVFDCAHNTGGFFALKESLKLFEYEKLFLVFAVMKDKNFKKMLQTIKWSELFATKTDPERGLEPKKIQQVFPKTKIFSNICIAVKTAQKKATPQDMILVAGSINAIGKAIKCLKK